MIVSCVYERHMELLWAGSDCTQFYWLFGTTVVWGELRFMLLDSDCEIRDWSISVGCDLKMVNIFLHNIGPLHLMVNTLQCILNRLVLCMITQVYLSWMQIWYQNSPPKTRKLIFGRLFHSSTRKGKWQSTVSSIERYSALWHTIAFFHVVLSLHYSHCLLDKQNTASKCWE